MEGEPFTNGSPIPLLEEHFKFEKHFKIDILEASMSDSGGLLKKSPEVL
ncbi:MAG TPA: hypothetical protein VK436_08750 [Methanocella sp.]|nr:hypothetical protein [Methanocella sp.]